MGSIPGDLVGTGLPRGIFVGCWSLARAELVVRITAKLGGFPFDPGPVAGASSDHALHPGWFHLATTRSIGSLIDESNRRHDKCLVSCRRKEKQGQALRFDGTRNAFISWVLRAKAIRPTLPASSPTTGSRFSLLAVLHFRIRYNACPQFSISSGSTTDWEVRCTDGGILRYAGLPNDRWFTKRSIRRGRWDLPCRCVDSPRSHPLVGRVLHR